MLPYTAKVTLQMGLRILQPLEPPEGTTPNTLTLPKSEPLWTSDLQIRIHLCWFKPRNLWYRNLLQWQQNPNTQGDQPGGCRQQPSGEMLG